MFERIAPSPTSLPLSSGAHVVRPAHHVSAPRVQTKLTIGAVDDPLEREADEIADAVVGSGGGSLDVSSAPPQVQRMCQGCEEEEPTVRGKGATVSGPVAAAPAAAITGSRGQGRALSSSERGYFEPRFGHRFDRVRIHDGAQATQLSESMGARAFSFGEDIFLGRGQYQPSSADGQRLLAHELAHTLQQSRRDRG
jgi:hypothetical protein